MKWLSVVVPVVIAVFGSLTDVLAPLIAANPKLALWVGVVGSIVTALAHSPLGQKPQA